MIFERVFTEEYSLSFRRRVIFAGGALAGGHRTWQPMPAWYRCAVGCILVWLRYTYQLHDAMEMTYWNMKKK